MAYTPVDIEEAVKRECKRSRYSERTAKTYIFCINGFLKSTKKTIDKISKKDVREFLENLHMASPITIKIRSPLDNL